MESGFLNHNPAWRTYKYSGKKKDKLIADEETVQKIITALENESLKYETYYKLIIATGMRRGGGVLRTEVVRHRLRAEQHPHPAQRGQAHRGGCLHQASQNRSR